MLLTLMCLQASSWQVRPTLNDNEGHGSSLQCSIVSSWLCAVLCRATEHYAAGLPVIACLSLLKALFCFSSFAPL